MLDFLPTASLQTIERRADLLRFVRAYFDGCGYCEVETPLLSHDVVVDAYLDPFVTRTAAGEMLFLQTSPEFGMKRLLVAGAKAIYQITRAFRRGETGLLHNPEFTLLEWYKVGDSHHEQMELTEQLVGAAFNQFGRTVTTPFERLAYDAAFERHLGTPVLQLSCKDLQALTKDRGIEPPASLRSDDRDGWLNLLLTECVEPHLGTQRPAFLYDYPASQCALAKVRDDDPPVAERFELYIDGIELCNGYHELSDPDELRRRMKSQAKIRAVECVRELPQNNRLLAAMETGLPPCAGVALGFDRLALLAFGLDELSQVVAFPIDRA